MERDHIVKSYDEELISLKNRVAEMGAAAGQQISDAVRSITSADSELAANVIHQDENINRMHLEAEERIILLLAQRQPVAVDLRAVISSLKIFSELERIGDYAVNIVKHLDNPKQSPEVEFIPLIAEMAGIGHEMLKDVIIAYEKMDAKLAVDVWHRDDFIDEIYTDLFDRVRNHLEPGNAGDYTGLISAARSCERIGDHITNMAENIYYIEYGKPYMGESVTGE